MQERRRRKATYIDKLVPIRTRLGGHPGSTYASTLVYQILHQLVHHFAVKYSACTVLLPV